MAKRNDVPPVSEERTENLFYDKNGKLVLRLGFATRENENDTHRSVEHIESSAGTMWSLVSLTRQGPDRITLQTCDACVAETRRSWFRRSSSKMTLSPAPEVRRCLRCRAALCAKHYYLSPYDGQPRCRRCHRWHWIYECIIKPLLWIETK
jgi:hypothetical protein